MKYLDDKRTIMGLYDIDGERINVYSLEPKIDEIYNYKKNELNKIDKEKVAYIASTDEGEPILNRGYLKTSYYTYMNGGGLDCERKTTIKSSKLSFTEKDIYNHLVEDHNFKPWDEETKKKLVSKLTKKELIEDYCHKVEPLRYLKVIDDANIGVDALILLSGIYDIDYSSYYKRYINPYIINIPMTLYKLEQFLHGNFDKLDLQELKQILELFQINNSLIYSIKIQDLKNMSKYLPVPGIDLECQIRNHEGDAKVIKLLKH